MGRSAWNRIVGMVGLAGTVFVMTPGPVAAQIVVRTYNNFGVGPEDLAVARVTAEASLRDAGIDVSWVDCWFRRSEPENASPICKQPLTPRDVVLRLQAGQISREKIVSMGFSLIGAGPDRPYLSTVFPDAVESVSTGAGVDGRAVLGLAIAHEIGHLMLNTTAHARAGLMRAGWSRNELRRHALRDWQFLDDERAVIRSAMETRAR